MLSAAFAGWCAYVAIDFLTHAVFLSHWWRATAVFWLPPAQLFRRIPFAYASFALYAAGLVWLLLRYFGHPPPTFQAARLSLVVGLFLGTLQALANHSVLSLPASALLVWPLSVSIGSAAAGFSSASVLGASHPFRAALRVLAFALAAIVVGVVLQNLFFPTASGQLSATP